jgi:hypothetical protein
MNALAEGARAEPVAPFQHLTGWRACTTGADYDMAQRGRESMTRTTAVATLAFLLCAGCAVHTGSGSAKGEACRVEMEKFCKNVQPGEGRIVKCLRDHEAGLSDECRAYVNTAMLYTACIDDATRFCPNIQPGGARVMACLREHMTDLSTACKWELDRMQR